MEMELWTTLLVTAKISLAAALMALVFGVGLAYAVNRISEAARPYLDAFFTIPMILPPTVVGFALLWLIGRKGLIASATGLNLSLVFTWQGAVLASAIVAFPLVYRSSRAAFAQIDEKLVDAGRILGLGELMIFLRICFPLARKGIMAGGLLALARATGEFGATLMVGGNIPGVTQTVSLSIYEAVQSGRDSEALALCAVTVLAAMATLLGIEWLLKGQNR
jgi:molybdate transport system permease protein